MVVKVLLVEDEALWQQGISSLLEGESRIQLIGIADNADDAELFFKAEQPDILLLDWKIKGSRDGFELARSLEKNLHPDQIIMVTGSPPDQIPENPYGYIPKSKIASELVPQILNRVSAAKRSV